MVPPRKPAGISVVLQNCAGCWKKFHLCKGCRYTWVACSEECRIKWREEAAKGLPKEPLLPPMGAKAKKPKGYAVYQKELYADLLTKGAAMPIERYIGEGWTFYHEEETTLLCDGCGKVYKAMVSNYVSKDKTHQLILKPLCPNCFKGDATAV
jgi:hypothetical protein